MIRTVEEVVSQTAEAFENNVMNKIELAASNRQYSVTVGNSEVPDFLALKLEKYGYIVERDPYLTAVKILWGTDAE